MKEFGIDISTWQGDFDFDRAVAEGVKFVIIKGGGGDDGLYVDRRFAENYRRVKAKGLPVGCYWFSKAMSRDEAVKEAAYFYDNVLKGRQFDLPVYIDVENREQLALGKRALTDVVKTWLGELERRNMLAGIYSSRYYFDAYLYDGELTAYPHWVASWTETCSYTPKSCFGMWQFGGETNLLRSNKVAGVVCDQDYMLTDYPSLIRREGKNGYGAAAAPAPAPASTALCTVTLPMLERGDEGGHVRTLQILLNRYNDAGLAEDGGFGPATERAVLAYQRDRGLAADGVVGRATWTQLLK